MENSLKRIESRQLEILKAIIEEYVASQEPVGSKALAQRRSIGVSPATIRNDMALLEDAGLITQPHTSAGRVPTNKGYRLFVDKLAKVKPLSPAERRAFENFLEGSHDLNEIVTRTVRLLAQVTKQVAVVQYPSLTRSKVRHVELILLASTRAMLVLITDTGRVEQRVVEVSDNLSESLLIDMRNRLNNLVSGKSLSEVGENLSQFTHAYTQNDRVIATILVASLIELAVEKAEERVVVAGAANLARSPDDFDSEIHSILEALEEQVVLLRLVTDPAMVAESVRVRIGDELPEAKLKATSFVGASYGKGAALGVLGPTRMDYAGSMRTVSAIAGYLSRFLDEKTEQ